MQRAGFDRPLRLARLHVGVVSQDPEIEQAIDDPEASGAHVLGAVWTKLSTQGPDNYSYRLYKYGEESVGERATGNHNNEWAPKRARATTGRRS